MVSRTRTTPPKSFMWEPSQATLDIGLCTSIVVERVPPQGAPTLWEPKGTKRLLQLQPDQHDRYPFVCDSMNLTKDQSLLRINATITGFLCSNSRSQQDRHRHYWVVEFENGIPKYAYDSLQGKQRLTTELAKRLRVFGVLLNVGNEHVPFLRTKYLDEAAGVVPAIHRGRNPIVVLGRGRIQWARNALCKRHKAPIPRKGRVQKHILKGSKQNHPNGKPIIMTRSTRGPTTEKKSGRSHTYLPSQEKGKQGQLGKLCRGFSLKHQVLRFHKDIA